MKDCVFCKVIAKELSSQIVYEDDLCIAFNDIAPAAPTHVLVVPKEHIASLLELNDEALLGQLMMRVKKVATELGLDKNGYRVVINTGNDGGQTVDHLHIHLLSGRSLTWPPG